MIEGIQFIQKTNSNNLGKPSTALNYLLRDISFVPDEQKNTYFGALRKIQSGAENLRRRTTIAGSILSTSCLLPLAFDFIDKLSKLGAIHFSSSQETTTPAALPLPLIGLVAFAFGALFTGYIRNEVYENAIRNSLANMKIINDIRSGFIKRV